MKEDTVFKMTARYAAENRLPAGAFLLTSVFGVSCGRGILKDAYAPAMAAKLSAPGSLLYGETRPWLVLTVCVCAAVLYVGAMLLSSLYKAGLLLWLSSVILWSTAYGFSCSQLALLARTCSGAKGFFLLLPVLLLPIPALALAVRAFSGTKERKDPFQKRHVGREAMTFLPWAGVYAALRMASGMLPLWLLLGGGFNG